MIKKAVILCGGLGTRLLPITKTIPKEMMMIFNKPAIEWCIEDLKQNGINEILIVLGRNKECLENYFDLNLELNPTKQNCFDGLNIYFVRQQHPKGTGFALLKAKNFVKNEPFLLVYPDELLLHESFAKTLLLAFKKTNSNVVPLKKIKISQSENYGMVKTLKTPIGHKILEIHEKPKPEKSPSNICYSGGGVFLPEIFDFINLKKTHGGEVFLTDAFDGLIKKNHLFGVFLNGTRLDIGSPLGLLKANVLTGLLKDSTNEFKKFLKKLIKRKEFWKSKMFVLLESVKLAKTQSFLETAWLKTLLLETTAQLNMEQVVIKYENSVLKDSISLGPFAHIRPNCLIKSNCKIGNFVEIKNSCIFEGTKASHLAYVGDSIVGKNCNIGCGVVFANFDGRKKHSCVLGNNVFVGCNSNLVAPLVLAKNTFVCAGTTVTHSTKDFDFVVGRSKQTTKPNKAKSLFA